MLGSDHWIQCDVRIAKRRYGADWADWVVSPGLLGPESIVYSFGLGQDVTFETELIGAVNCRVYGFDPTPKSLQYLQSQKLPKKFSVLPYGLSTINGEKSFGDPVEGDSGFSFSTRSSVRHSTKLAVRTLRSIMDELNHPTIDLLKIDIEGEEFDVIEQMIAAGIQPGQFLVEFHHVPKWGLGKLSDSRRSVDRLHKAGYLIFDISPGGREFSFIHRSVLSRYDIQYREPPCPASTLNV